MKYSKRDDMEDFFSPSSYNNGERTDKESVVTTLMYPLKIPKQYNEIWKRTSGHVSEMNGPKNLNFRLKIHMREFRPVCLPSLVCFSICGKIRFKNVRNHVFIVF